MDEAMSDTDKQERLPNKLKPTKAELLREEQRLSSLLNSVNEANKENGRLRWEAEAERDSLRAKVAQLEAALDDVQALNHNQRETIRSQRAHIEKLEAALREARERWLSDDLGSNDGDDFLRRVDNLLALSTQEEAHG
jgi:chromosome segregation ATPase